MHSRSLFQGAAVLLLLSASPLFAWPTWANEEAPPAAVPAAKLAPDAGVSLPPELLAVPGPTPSSPPPGPAPEVASAVPAAPEPGAGTPGAQLALEGRRSQPDLSSPALAGGDRDRALVVRVEIPF